MEGVSAALVTLDQLDSDFWITAGTILFLLVLSGFFSGSETALTAASKARIHQQAKSGDKKAQRLEALIDDKEKLIGAILLGNNLVNILASALATRLFLDITGEKGIIYATLTMTMMVLIFAEVLPKSLAIANPDKMARSVSGIMRIVVFLFSPIVALVRSIVWLTLRLFGINIADIQNKITAQEEIRGTIDLQHHEGALVKEDRQMLGSILDLEDMTVEEVMVHRSSMHAIDIKSKNDDILSKIVHSPFTRIPVYEDTPENIIGVMHAKDVLRAIRRVGGQLKRFNPRRVMVKAWFVPETTTLKEQLNAFLERKTHFALVVNEYGDLQGLVTLEDILEEIVGDITDEHDFDVPGVKSQSDGSVQVEGTVAIRDLNRMFDWALEDDNSTTIAGLVIHEAETIPIVGNSFTFDGYRFEVTARHRNQLTGIRITKL
ncbi:MAG: hypothetical protein COB37_02620 [Kordiimonadales bacterium]|nr:MAG: hypothetical protein COB37_02620 [Kordiimonadales bacterium]